VQYERPVVLVLPMLKCWKALAGLEDVIKCLEARAWQPERLMAAS
jgi:hypothetical protein